MKTSLLVVTCYFFNAAGLISTAVESAGLNGAVPSAC